MAQTKRMLDLFSGFGGASEAFVEDPDWEVIRIENNPLLGDRPFTQIRDVREWADWLDSLGKFDLVWASPPCLDFARLWLPWTRKKLPPDFEPDMTLVEAAMAIIEVLDPKWWVIENVIGARAYFKPQLGEPAQVIHAFNLWGRFPHIGVPQGWDHVKPDKGSQDPLRSNHRAMIPWEISEGLRSAVDHQWTLARWQG